MISSKTTQVALVSPIRIEWYADLFYAADCYLMEVEFVMTVCVIKLSSQAQTSIRQQNKRAYKRSVTIPGLTRTTYTVDMNVIDSI